MLVGEDFQIKLGTESSDAILINNPYYLSVGFATRGYQTILSAVLLNNS